MESLKINYCLWKWLKVVRKLAFGRALDTKADEKNNETVVIVVCRLFLVIISCVPYNIILLIAYSMFHNLYYSKSVHTPKMILKN